MNLPPDTTRDDPDAEAAVGSLCQGIRQFEARWESMTAAERAKPELIKASRKRRIAAGAGVQVQEVNRLLNQFEQMQSMMKKLKGGGMMKMMRAMGGMKGGMKGLLPGGR